MSTRAKASTSKESANASATTLSAEQLRRKAKFQLLGSAVLVVLGVVLFAVLLDSPPRPNTNQVSILIPARDSLAPLALPSAAPAASTAPALTPSAAPSVGVVASAASAASPNAGASAKAAPAAPVSTANVSTTSTSGAAAVAAASSASPAMAGAPGAVAKPAATAATAPVKATDTTATQPADAPRYVVQVGAFTDAQKIRDVRAKLERAGVKTYAQVVQTNDGQRTRVRVGPFATKAEADKAAAKIKTLDLPAALLTL